MRLLRLFVLVLTFGLVGPVWPGPVEQEIEQRGSNVSLPKPRPATPPPPSVPDTTPEASVLDPDPGSETHGRASISGARKADDSNQSVDQSRVVPKDIPPIPHTTITAPPVQSACLSELMQGFVAAKADQPVVDDPGCTIPDPVQLISTKGGYPVSFSAGLVLDCPFAATLAGFVSDIVQPLARHHMGSPLVKISSGQGFVCRRRNNADDGKLSEHALGNATDWIGFEFADGQQLTIRDTSQMQPNEAQFSNAVRTAACGAFTTVLGPGSNEAHATHLHFDLGRAAEKKNPYRICE